MMTSITVLTKKTKMQDHITSRGDVFNYEFTSKRGYLDDSEYYSIKGGFEAEVIQNPGIKFIQKNIFSKVIQELRYVTLKAFGKTFDQSDVYTPDHVMRKNVLFVDWLTVIRKDSIIVAYTTGSYIEKNIFYTNATMVLPEYQNSKGLGIVPNMYIWNKLNSRSQISGASELKLICRTKNKNVVSLLSHIWLDLRLSAAETCDCETRKFFRYCADQLSDSSYDAAMGISRNIYPQKMPVGTDNRHIENYKAVFNKIGDKDAMYVCGKANSRKIKDIIKKETQVIHVENCDNNYRELTEAVA